MASRGLGTLTLDLVAKIGGFTSALGKAERDLDTRSRNIEKRARALEEGLGLLGIRRGGTRRQCAREQDCN